MLKINQMKMKLFRLRKVFCQSAIYFILLFLVFACETEPEIRFGFDTEFNKHSQGLSVMYVSSKSQIINLKGDITLNEGQVLVELVNAARDTLFTQHLMSPDNLTVNESFQAVAGNWKLKYKSIEGTGTLVLHLNNETQNYYP